MPDLPTLTLVIAAVALAAVLALIGVGDRTRRRNAELTERVADLATRLSQHLVVTDETGPVYDGELWDLTGAPSDVGVVHVNRVTVRLRAAIPRQRTSGENL